MLNTYNISYNIAGLIILLCLFIILKTIYAVKSKSHRLFTIFVCMCFFSGLLDTLTACTIDNAKNIPAITNEILNTIYLLVAFLATYSGIKYVLSSVDLKSKLHSICDILMICAYTTMLFVNLFTGFLFDFTNGKYNKGPLFLVTFLASFYFILHMTLVLAIKRKSFTKRQLIIFGSFVFLPLCFSTVQIFFPYYLLTVFATSITTLLMLFGLETPDFVELEYLRKNLEKEVIKQTQKATERQKQIENMSMETVEALGQAIDEKDEYTRGHSIRVSNYSVLMAEKLGWDSEKIHSLKWASILHDIGKIGIPDLILQKPNKLTEDEYKIIKLHTTKGARILEVVTTLPYAAMVAKYHHERFDGGGYPEGLKGNDIPEFARIVNIADSFDAMSTRRVYRDKLPREEIRRRLVECRGTQFDPVILDAFLELLDEGKL